MTYHKTERCWPCKDQRKPWVFGFLTNADNKQKNLALCHWACVYVCSRGDFNLNVVMSPLWSSLCGVAICSVAWSSTRQRFLCLPLYLCHRLFLSLYLQSLLNVCLLFFLCILPLIYLFCPQSGSPFFLFFTFVPIDLKKREREGNGEKDTKRNDSEQNTHIHTYAHTPLLPGRQADRRTDGQTGTKLSLLRGAWN